MRLFISLFTLLAIVSAQDSDLGKLLDGYAATMVIYDQSEQNYIIVNEERAAERFSPFSTHKIPHSLIALETGIVPDIESTLSWDEDRYPQEPWWPETWQGQHNLRSAIKVSLVPAYRQIAWDLGPETMGGYLKRFNYGNWKISSGVDSYWLDGSLKISAMDQVNFLRRFYSGELGVKEKTTRDVKQILIREQTGEYTFSHKTGTGTTNSGAGHAWLVGYIERDGNVYFFAFNMEAGDFNEAVALRMKIARGLLHQHGLIEIKSP